MFAHIELNLSGIFFLAALDEDSDGNQLVFYVVGTKGGFPALSNQPDTTLHNFTQEMLNRSQIVFNHKGECLESEVEC